MSRTAMDGRSSYLKYLPAVLWRDEPADATLTLSSSLRIFEKVLQGIDDGVLLTRSENRDVAYPSLAAEIAALHEVFDPWASPASDDRDLLAWLAGRLGLTFPTLLGKDLWDEYQRRNATSKVGGIHRRRGQRAGLRAYLDLYAAGQVAPRIAIDDGARILVVLPKAAGWAQVCGLVTQGPLVAADGTLRSEGLMRPQCLAVGPDGSIFAGEAPLPPKVSLPGFQARVWRFAPTGEYRCSTAPPEAAASGLVTTEPRRYPLAPSSLSLLEIRAVAVAPVRSGRPETTYVLEQSGRLTAVAAPYERTGAGPVPAAVRIGTIAVPGTRLAPVAMAVDPGSGDLLVLDRGSGAGTANPPKIISVSVDPFAMNPVPLTTVAEPLSLLVEADGTLLIGDGGVLMPAPSPQPAGNLVRVDRAPSPWLETPLFPAENLLRAPTGIARTDDGRLYVLDAGLKPFSAGVAGFTRPVAEPATVFAVTEEGTATLSRVVAPGSFVYPVGMVASGSRLLVCDRGDFDSNPDQPSWTRIKPFEFDVVIHWAEPRLPKDPSQRHQRLARIVGDIRTVVEQQKPAHTVMNLVTRY